MISRFEKSLKRAGFLVFLISTFNAFGQSVANYTPAMSTGITYTSIAGTGSSVAQWRNNAGNQNNENRSFPISLGFDFWYLGTRYSAVSIDTNGFLDFSGTAYDGNASSGPGYVNCGGHVAYSYDPVSFSTSGCPATPPTSYSGTYIALAPLYTDLWVSGGTAALSSSIKYLTTGTAPNRVFTAEYVNFDDFASGVASFNFQVKLYESTGKIEFVYGTMTGSAGSTTSNYTLGINNSTMSTTPLTSELLVQQTANSGTFSNTISNTLTAFPVSNSQISFTSVAPANPGSSLTFTGTSSTATTLNWTDWATNELGYVIYNSTDGLNYTFVSQVATNAVTATVNTLMPGTTYFWNVYAVTEGTLSSALTGTQATLSGSSFVSAQTGPWNTGSTWIGGSVPTSGDNATISSGHVVTIDGSNSINDLSINGTLQIGNNATARIFTVFGNTSISGTGSFVSSSAATHSLILLGDLTNSGTFNMVGGAGSLTNVTLNKNGNQTISGTGSTTTFNLLTLNMGTSLSNVADFTCSNFSAASNFLTLTNGTFKFSVPTSAVTLNLFSLATTVPSTAAIIMNSPNSVMNFLTTATFQGDLTLNSGAINAGNAANENLMSYGSNITINGGTLTVAGRFSRPSYVAATYFTMTAGTMIVNTLGSTDTAPAASTATSFPFMMDVPGSKFNMTAGTIIIRRSGSGTALTNAGYNVTNVTNYNFSGGTLQIGDASTPVTQTLQVNTDQPIANLFISSTNNPIVTLGSALTVTNSVAITGGTLNCSSKDLTVGGNFSNDGTFTAGTNTTTFNGTSTVSGASITTFNSLLIASSSTLNGHIVNMNVTGNWTNNGGNFNPGTATVTFTSNLVQAINGTAATQSFYNFTVNKSGSTLSVLGSTNTITIANNYTQAAGGFTPSAGGTVNVGGNWSHTTGAIFTPNASTVIFNGTGAQSIAGTIATETFYKLTVNKTAGTLLNAGGSVTAITLTGDFTETLGDFTSPANFNVAGNWTHDAGTFTAGATVTFNGGAAQTMSSAALTTENFNNLTVLKTAGTLLNISTTYTTFNIGGNYLNTQGNVTFPATVNVTGNVTLTLGTITAGTLIDVKGNWSNNGATFTAGTSLVSFTGPGAQAINGSVTTQSFYSLTINKSAGSTLTTAGASTLNILNDFTETSGNFTPLNTSITNVGGDWTHDAGTFTPGTGASAVVFNGTGAQTISSASLIQETFNIMTVNKTAGLLNTGGAITAITVSSTFNNTQGNFTAPATLTITGNATLTAGTLTAGNLVDVKANWTNNGATFSPGTGTISFTGTGAQSLGGSAVTQTFNNFLVNKSAGQTLTNAVSTTTINILGNYNQTQGNFTSVMNGTINVGGDWTHDAGTFTPNSGTVVFNGAGSQTISSAALVLETFYNLRVNKTVSTLLDTGPTIATITVTNNYIQTAGDFTPPATMNVAGNWTHDDGAFNPGTNTVNFTGGNAQSVSSAALTTETFYNLTVNKSAGLLSVASTFTTFSVGNNFTNTAGNFTAPTNLNVANDVLITAGVFTAGTTIDVKRNWTKNGGTFTPVTSVVSFTGTGPQQITGSSNPQTFYDLTVNKTAGTLLSTTVATLSVNSFTETQGDFTPFTNFNVAGNWTHDAGTFTPGTNTVTFNGTGAQTISSAALALETFNNMIVNKAAGLLNTGGTINAITVSALFTNTLGSFTAPATLTLTGNALLTAGTLTAGALVDVKANWTNNGVTFTPGTGTISFTGTGAQSLAGSLTTQTFNNFLVNKSIGQTLTHSGSTTINILGNYNQTQGNFTALNASTINITGNWVHDTGTFTPNTSTVLFNSTGAQSISSAALLTETFYNLRVNKTAGTVLTVSPTFVTLTVTNIYTQTQGDFTPPATMNVGGNWVHDAGAFNAGTGLVVFTGGAAQVMSSAALTTESFNNLTISKSGGILSTTTFNTINVGGNYINTAGGFTFPATVNIAGTVTLTAGTVTGGTLVDVKGASWTNNGGTFTPGSSTVSFTSTTPQVINGTAGTQTFNNLIINKTANGLSTAGSTITLTLNGNYTQTLGDFTAPATVNVAGNWTHDAGTFTPGTNTVNFNGTGTQNITSAALTSEAFYNFIMNKTIGTLSTSGTITNLDVNQTVTLTSGTFVAPTTMTVFLGWSKSSGSTFTPGTGTVTFDGTAAQIINGTATSQTFNNFTVNKTVATALTVGGSTTQLTVQDYTNTQGNFTPPATFNVNGNTVLTAGTFTAGTTVNLSGNWTYNGGTFTAGTNTVTFKGTAQQTIVGSLSTTFGKLAFNNTFGTAPQVIVSAPVLVNTSLTMTAGQVQTDITNIIKLAAVTTTSNLGSAASFISGPIQYVMASSGVTTGLNFPIGKNGIYGGASLSIRHSAATSYTYTAEVIHSSAMALGYTLAAGTTHVSGLRYWDIKRGLSASPLTTDNSSITTGASGPRITLYYEVADQVTDPTNLTIVKNIGGASVWNDIAGVASGAAPGNIISAAGNANFTSFSYFTLANKTGGSNALPISLISFSGSQIGNNVVLNWSTESELNNARFDVERLADGEKFAVLGSVKGAGNSTTTLSYSFADRKAAMGINYYRLSQYDFDGTATQSKVIAINFEEKTAVLSIGVSPNPSSSERMNISVSGASKDGQLLLKIIDMTGRTVAERNDTIDDAAYFTWEFLQPLSPGMYILQGTQGYSKSQYKLVVH